MQAKNSPSWDALRQLTNHIAALQNLILIQPAIEQAVLSIVFAIAGEPTAAYVDDFLKENQHRIMIDRYPGFDKF